MTTITANEVLLSLYREYKVGYLLFMVNMKMKLSNLLVLLKFSVVFEKQTKVITYEVIFNGASCATGQKY